MKISRCYLLFITFALYALISGCTPDTGIPKDRILENGYRFPEATQENLEKLLKQSLENMVFVEGGSYLMGDSGFIRDGERVHWSVWADNFPAHKVILDSFSISKYEVTFWEYDVYTEVRKITPVGLKVQHRDRRRDNFAVGDVTWQQAQDFCLWLGEQTGLPFSLPTEAQWEYAARSRGEHVGFATDNGKMEPGRNHFKHDIDKHGIGIIINRVGTYPPNPLGLYDMAGNIFEWVYDWYDPKYYEVSPEFNPVGPKTGTHKILRGGGAGQSVSANNVYQKHPQQVVFKEDGKKHRQTIFYYGFRCAVNSKSPIKPNALTQ